MTWKPIETAPREQKVIIGWRADDVWHSEFAYVLDDDFLAGGLCIMSCDHFDRYPATHWMPAPPDGPK